VDNGRYYKKRMRINKTERNVDSVVRPNCGKALDSGFKHVEFDGNKRFRHGSSFKSGIEGGA
jgi:hypothetical protein